MECDHHPRLPLRVANIDTVLQKISINNHLTIPITCNYVLIFSSGFMAPPLGKFRITLGYLLVLVDVSYEWTLANLTTPLGSFPANPREPIGPCDPWPMKENGVCWPVPLQTYYITSLYPQQTVTLEKGLGKLMLKWFSDNCLFAGMLCLRPGITRMAPYMLILCW